jgi:uncharacterized protein YbjQ (UPF0145 family)
VGCLRYAQTRKLVAHIADEEHGVSTAIRSGFITTTESDLKGYRVMSRMGVVRGITVRSRSVFGTVGAKLQQIVGGNISLLTDLCEQTRAEAFALAVQHAEALGANALVGVRYDATEIMSGVSEVLCYGTAMRVVPEREYAATQGLGG